MAGDASIQALATQHTDFDFDHVQPAGALGDIMELEPAQHPPRFTRGKGVVERARRVRRQIVQDDLDALRLWEVNVSKLAHADGEVHGGAAVADFDLAPGLMHVEEDEQIGRTVALILAIVALDLARLGRDRLADLADELGRALVETDDRVLRVGRFGIEIEHILHAGDIFSIDMRNTPHVLAPGLEVVFGQTPAHGLAGETVMGGKLDQFTRQ